MRFDPPLVPGRLLQRYKRFLADVRLDATGEVVVAHVANSGSMLRCAPAGARVWLSHHPDPGRKLAWSWQLVTIRRGLVCVNTGLPNRLVAEALARGRIAPLRGYREHRPEVAWGTRGSRLDFCLSGYHGPEPRPERCYVEVKNVTLDAPDPAARLALFPDAVTTRGTRHLEELAEIVAAGHRACLLFVVSRGDCDAVAPAEDIDPVYARTLRAVAREGVEVLAAPVRLSRRGLWLRDRLLPVRL